MNPKRVLYVFPIFAQDVSSDIKKKHETRFHDEVAILRELRVKQSPKTMFHVECLEHVRCEGLLTVDAFGL